MSIDKTGIDFLDKKIDSSLNQLSLPFWSDVNRSMPNHIARSSLFTPIKRGARTFFDNESLYSRRDVSISYTGRRLDESDADLWMQLMHYYRDTPSNERVFINRSDLLTSLGKSRTSSAYKWLEEAMTRLHGSIKIKTKKYVISSPLIQKYAIDEESNKYYIKIDSQIAKLFGNQEFSIFDWNRRLALEYDLSKSLQRHVGASSVKKQTYTYEVLIQRFKREGGNVKYLKRDLHRACEELKLKKILCNYKIGDTLIIWKNSNIT